MMKRGLLGLLIIATGIAIDYIYHFFSRIAGETFNLGLSQLLLNLRPIVFLIWYFLLMIIVQWLLINLEMSYLISTLYIIMGLVVLIITMFPAYFGNIDSRIYHILLPLAGSTLSLTIHSGSILIAIGLFSIEN